MALAQIVLAACGLLFLLDAVDKTLNLRGFVQALSAYELLPQSTAFAAAVLLAATEFAVGAALLGRFEVLTAAAMGAGMLLVFAAAMAINLSRGRTDLECGCGTAARGQRLQWRLVARNGVLACVLISMAFATDSGQSLEFPEVLPGAFGLAWVYLAMSAVWASGSTQKWRLGST